MLTLCKNHYKIIKIIIKQDAFERKSKSSSKAACLEVHKVRDKLQESG